MKILILGHARHGKDTLAELLREETGLTFASSSQAALDVIAPVLELVTGETDRDRMFEQRVEHRELWKRLISLYNASDRAALARKILETSDIYVGMRCAKEYEACRFLFRHILWVDASERVDMEDPTMAIEFEPSMLWVDNSGGLEDLRKQARWLKSVFYSTPTGLPDSER